MKKIFNGHENESGVYTITNINNNKMYIGSTKNFKIRYRQHLRTLLASRHKNIHLQNSFNKYGKQAFVFEIAEVVLGDRTLSSSVEQKYLDDYITSGRWGELYNISKFAIQKYNNQSFDKMISAIEKRKNIWNNKSKEEKNKTRHKISVSKNNFYKTEDGIELIKKISEEKLGKSYIDRYGKERADEIKKKISDNKLIEMNKPEVKTNLRNMLLGISYEERFGKYKAKEIKMKQSVARKGKYTGPQNSRYRIFTNIILVSPDGNIYTEVYGIKDFAILHGLSKNHLCELLNGKRKSHKGWKLG